MTDARIPDRWLQDRRLQRLNDAHFRAFITSLVWSVTNRTDGVIEPEDLGLIPNFAAKSVQAMVAAGLWQPLEKGWLITDYVVTQTSKDQLVALENMRARERQKKARQRAQKKGDGAAVPGTVPGDVPWDNTGQDRPGKDRPGEGDHPTSVPDHPRWRGAGSDPFQEYN
ncbi:hypothetical protein [Mycolicibacterium grossiae]|uniref:Uncharacterized protein n=1 Tax=Mycolicibacterium grossiae TaxID=1552759 RepID=A0A1E8Q3C9_9MYCO|nr:hypothetical protein [Mycolicibacterium grossiae]OFJ52559.1 hypothetical protein BEL07_17090 [Mycolicibacterium grossiae]QEM47180.1 hypothetical protein FZ046_22530 [Mycolicibacterium grossiae]